MFWGYLRPLLKLVDKLLLVGILQDDDIMKLLIMIDPRTWDPDFDPGECCLHFCRFIHTRGAQ